MFASLLEVAKHSAPDSLEVNVADWMIFVRITGLRCAEYAHKNQSGVDEHLYPSGKRVAKAFLTTDWEFYDDTGAIISIHPLNSEPQDFPKKLRVTFRIQKNRQNGQKLTLVTDDDHPDICPVRAAYRIFLRAKRLGQSDLQPLGLFVNKFGITKYLRGNKIADTLSFAARTAHPDMPEDELKCFSSHSGRVWALVLLDEAGMTPDFIVAPTLDGRFL